MKSIDRALLDFMRFLAMISKDVAGCLQATDKLW
jgi:hypothetical protein